MNKTQNTLSSIFSLARKKYQIDQKRGDAKYLDVNWMLDEIVAEVDEVREEIKPNNSVYLEDELGDILWGLVVLAISLEEKGLISSAEALVDRCLQKYEERISPLQGEQEDEAIWDQVKQKQKITMQEENEKRHKGD